MQRKVYMITLRIKGITIIRHIIIPWIALIIITFFAWIFGITSPSYTLYITAIFIAFYLGFKPLHFIFDMWNYDRTTLIQINTTTKNILYKPYREFSINHQFDYDDIDIFEKYKNGECFYQQSYFYRIVLKNGEEFYLSSLLAGKLEKIIDSIPCVYMKNQKFVYVLGYI